MIDKTGSAGRCSPFWFELQYPLLIDWWNLVANALWIFALALALAAFSWAGWRGVEQGAGLRRGLTETGVQRALRSAGLLFSLGLALTSAFPLERTAWFAFSAFFMYLLLRSMIRRPAGA